MRKLRGLWEGKATPFHLAGKQGQGFVDDADDADDVGSAVSCLTRARSASVRSPYSPYSRLNPAILTKKSDIPRPRT